MNFKKGKPTIYRIYANAIEMVFQEAETDEKYSGATEIIRKNVELFKMVREMILNRDNDIGKKLAVLNLRHPKLSVRWCANEIATPTEEFEVVDRSHITL